MTELGAKEGSMGYVPLQVPEHLYLQWLALLAGAAVEHQASAEIVAENQELRQQVFAQREENDRLRDLLSAELAAAGKLDQDDSYPDHGEEDDRAASMGLPAKTTGALP